MDFSSFDIDIGTMPSAAASAYETFPTLSSHSLLSHETSVFSNTTLADSTEEHQPVEPSLPEPEWIDALLNLLLLDADERATSLSWDNSFTGTADPANLSLAHTGHPVVPRSRAQPGAPMSPVPVPLTPLGDSLRVDAPSASISLADSQQHTNTAPACVSHPAPAVPRAQALPPPAAHAPSQTGRKPRAHPYALVCPRCPFVQQNGRAWDLERHVRTHDAGRQKFVCDRRGCEEGFSRKDAMRRHQKNANARCATAQGGDV